MYEIFAKLLQEHNKTPYRVYKDTGISQTTLSEWKNGKVTPKADKLQIIAEYFGVTIDYLMGNEQKETPTLTKKDERDIEKKLNETLEELELSQDSLMFNGEPLDDITKELLIQSIRNGIELSKKLAKEKYTPKKYKK